MSTRRPRHRRADQTLDVVAPAERMLARLATAPQQRGWVPGPPGPSARQPARPPRSGRPLTDPTPGWRLRWVPSRRSAGGLALVLVLAALVALLMVWQARPAAQAAPQVRRLPSAAGPTAAVTPVVAGRASQPPVATASPGVVVHVVGAVRRPGLVRLPGGSRVADAVAAAGGLAPGARAASVNLARPLVDGEQLLVQRRGRPPIPAAPGAATGASPAAAGAPPGAPAGAPVNINTATLEQLDGLPGIGPVLAQRILDWRASNGRFSAVDELGEVSGIGEATLGDLRPLVTV